MTPAELLTTYAAMLRQPSVMVHEADGSVSEYGRVLARISRELRDGRNVEKCEQELKAIAKAVRERRV